MSENMPLREDWLSTIRSTNNKRKYSRVLDGFLQYLNVKTLEDLAALRKSDVHFENKIVRFHEDLQKKVSKNTASAYVIPIMSFFTYMGTPLRLRRKIPRIHMKLEKWRPALENLQQVYKVGDISVKAWLCLSRDIPGRMSDMLTITNDQIQSGEWMIESKKENVVGKCYTSPETQELFRQLKKANIELPRTQRGIDLMMDKACRIAGLPQRLNQHLLRKVWITKAIDLGIQETIIKILSFKSVPEEMLTYFLGRSDLRDYWKRVTDSIPLEGKSNGRLTSVEEELRTLKEALSSVEKENTISKVRIDNLQKKTMEYGETLAGMVEYGHFTEEEKEAIRNRYDLRKLTEEEKRKIEALKM
ncbi:hypothetical protein MUP37_04545 [Candidatus Bathyarchaeota archaeon]|nr:hypothetical protein [Candidatus Bathyarchaeota archaeon]